MLAKVAPTALEVYMPKNSLSRRSDANQPETHTKAQAEVDYDRLDLLLGDGDVDYDQLKEAAQELGIPVTRLIVLDSSVDPFSANTPGAGPKPSGSWIGATGSRPSSAPMSGSSIRLSRREGATRPNQGAKFLPTSFSPRVKSQFNLPVFLSPTGRRLPRAVKQGCLAPEIASGMAGVGDNQGCEGPVRLLREALLSSDRSFPPVGPIRRLGATTGR